MEDNFRSRCKRQQLHDCFSGEAKPLDAVFCREFQQHCPRSRPFVGRVDISLRMLLSDLSSNLRLSVSESSCPFDRMKKNMICNFKMGLK